MQAEAADEPLAVRVVNASDEARAMVGGCWAKQRKRSLYTSSDEFLALVFEVLSRDIRPVHRRLPASALWDEQADSVLPMYPGDVLPVGRYHVVLEGIDVSYDIDELGHVTLRGGMLNVVQSQQRGLGLLEAKDQGGQ